MAPELPSLGRQDYNETTEEAKWLAKTILKMLLFGGIIIAVLWSCKAIAGTPINSLNKYGYSIIRVEVRNYTTANGWTVRYDYWLRKRVQHKQGYLGIVPGTRIIIAWKGVDNLKGWSYTGYLGTLKVEVPVEVLHKAYPELDILARDYKDFFCFVSYVGYTGTTVDILGYPRNHKHSPEDAFRMYGVLN